MNTRHSLWLSFCIVAFAFAGCERRSDDLLPDGRVVENRPGVTSTPPSEITDFERDLVRMYKVQEVETKKANWRMMPEGEKAIRTTTGKVVFQSAYSRLVVSHYNDGSPRFAIQQGTPQSIGQAIGRPWITFGEQEAWTRDGKHIRFYAEDITPYGSWVLNHGEGRGYTEIGFENLDHTGELRNAYLYSSEGEIIERALYFVDRAEWFEDSEDQDWLREVEDAVKTVRECLRCATQAQANH